MKYKIEYKNRNNLDSDWIVLCNKIYNFKSNELAMNAIKFLRIKHPEKLFSVRRFNV